MGIVTASCNGYFVTVTRRIKIVTVTVTVTKDIMNCYIATVYGGIKNCTGFLVTFTNGNKSTAPVTLL